MNTVSYEKQIPVVAEYDVVVCGGGPAGIGAALAAAEQGCKTALIERFGFLGGMATAGYVNPMSEFAYNDKRVLGGIAWRFAQALVEAKGGLVEYPRANISFHPETYKLVAQELLLKAGVKLYMNSYLVDCQMDGDRVDSVMFVNKSGLAAVKAKYFIDATGDADLAEMAGMEFLPVTRPMQPGTLCFCLSGVDTTTERMHIIHQKNHRFNHHAVFVRDALFARREAGEDVPLFGGPWLATTLDEGTITVNMSRSAMNAVDSEDYQAAEIQMRRDVFRLVELLRENVEEFRNCRLTAVATMAGIRQSRRIHGLHVLTGDEYVNAVKFDDAIARSCHAVDIHLPNDEGQVLRFPTNAGYIPYRSLVDGKHPNLLVAGRAISADEEAFAATRVQAPCMETGQAAGIAAALCLKAGECAVHEVDSAKLVAIVNEMGTCVEHELGT